MHAPGFLDTNQSAEGRKEVHDASRLVLDAAAGDPVFPIDDAGNAVPAFEERSLFAAQLSVALLPVAAVVGGVDNDGVVELAECFKPGDQSSDGPVGVVDGAVVNRGLIVEGAVLGNDLVGRRDHGVGFVEPEIEKEGFVGVTLFIEPGEGLVDDDLAGVAFHRANRFTVTQKVGRVLVAGVRAVDEAEPVVEAMIAGAGIVAIVDGHAEMPLAEVRGGVAVLLEHLRDGRFALQKVHLVKTLGDDGIDSGTIVVAARKEGGARRGAARRSRVKICETHALGGQLV